MGRWKTVIGPKLKAWSFQNQKTEARIGTHILKQMTELGRPEFVPFARPQAWVRASSAQYPIHVTTPHIGKKD